LVQAFEPGSIKRVADLLAKYQTLSASLVIMRQYLDRARQVLPSLPLSDGRAGLLGLADYLARETDALAATSISAL
jgi:geranylgeranyl pyrophosphate synthase